MKQQNEICIICSNLVCGLAYFYQLVESWKNLWNYAMRIKLSRFIRDRYLVLTTMAESLVSYKYDRR